MSADVINSPVTAALIPGGIALLIAVFSHWNIQKANGKKTLEKKVDKSDCLVSMRRIGKQIDYLKECQEKLSQTQTKTEKALIFIVQQMDGDPASLGLMD